MPSWPQRLIPYIDAREIGEAAARLLLSDNHRHLLQFYTLNNGQRGTVVLKTAPPQPARRRPRPTVPFKIDLQAEATLNGDVIEGMSYRPPDIPRPSLIGRTDLNCD